MGKTSGTGVLFTRNPSTGENKLYGEFLINAQVIYTYTRTISSSLSLFAIVLQLQLMNDFCQGEDVVAGIRTPEDLDTMKSYMPEAYKELVENCEILERHYKDMMVNFLIPTARSRFKF